MIASLPTDGRSRRAYPFAERFPVALHLWIRPIAMSLLAASCWMSLVLSGAAQDYWNGTGTTWNNVNDWSTNSAAATPPPATVPNGIDVFFNYAGFNTPQTLTLDAAQNALGITFNSTGAVTINDATFALTIGADGITDNAGSGADTINAAVILGGGTESWTNNASTALTIGGAISGSGGFTFSGTGSGILKLSGANTYGGATTVSSGVVQITGGGANGLGLSPNSAVSVSNNAQLAILANGTYTATPTMSLTGSAGTSSFNPAAPNGAGALLFNVNGGNINFNVPISLSGTNNTEITTKSNGSTITLSGPITGGAAARTNFFGGGGAAVGNSHTIIVSNSGNTYLGNTEIIGGSANITMQISGGDNRLNKAGPLFLAGDNSAGTALKAWLDLNGNNQQFTTLALKPGGANGSSGTAPALGDNRIGNSSTTTLSTLTLTNSVNTTSTYNGALGGGPGNNFALSVGNSSGTPTYTLTLTGANTFAGGTIVNSKGTVKVTSGAGQSGSFTLSANSGAITVSSLAGLAVGESVTSSAFPAGTSIVNLPTSGTTITVSNPPTATGSQTVTFGPWDAAGNGSVTINSGGTFDLDGFSHAIDALSGAGTLADSVAGAVTLTLGINGGSGTYSGAVTNGAGGGPVSLIKTGAGGEILSGTYTYSGATTSITGGMLAFTGAALLPANSNVNMNGGVVGLGGNFSANLGTGTGQIQFTGNGGFAAVGADRVVNIGGAGATMVWGTTPNFVPGGSSLNFGNVAATNMVDFQNPLDLGGSMRTIKVDRGTGPVDAKMSGIISNSSAGGGIVKTGSGILQLAAANTFTGGLNVNGGTVQTAGSGNLGSSTGTVTINAGGTVDLNGTTQTIGNLNGAGGGTLTNNSSTSNATLNIASGGSVYGGAINDGTGGKTLNINLQAGNTTLTGTSNFTGTITVPTNVQLTLSGIQATGRQLGNGTATLSGGTLSLQGSTTFNQGITFNGYVSANNLNNDATPDPDYVNLATAQAHFASLTPGATALSTANGKTNFDFSNGGSATANAGGPSAIFGTAGATTADYGFTATLQFEVTFSGFLNVTQPGNVTFQTASDDCSMVFVNNQNTPVVNNNVFQAMSGSLKSGTYNFPSAGLYPIFIIYNQGTGQDGFFVQWNGNGHGMQTLLNSEVTTGTPNSVSQNYVGGVNVTATSTINVTAGLNATMGSLAINASTLNLTSADTTGSPYSLTFGATTLNGSATLNLANSQGTGSSTMTLGAVADGGHNYSLTKTGPGTLVFAAPSTFGGGTINSQGLIISNGAGNLGTGPVTLADTTTLRPFGGKALSTMSGFGGTSTSLIGAGTPWVVNNTAITSNPINNNVLTLTDGGGGEARSAFFNTPVPIHTGMAGFAASFTYQMSGGGNSPADGAAFILQNDSHGATALGGTGGALGFTGITPAAALQLNVFSGNGLTRGSNFITDGTTGTYNATDPVLLASGDPIQVVLSFDPASMTVTETLNDATAGTTYTTQYMSRDLVGLLGDTAYVGFSGATGGSTATQTISNFTYSIVDGTAPYANNVVLPAGGAATIDVGTSGNSSVVSMGTLVVPAGTPSTLNVTSTNANAPYGLVFAAATLGSNLTINVSTNGGGGTLTLGATSGTGFGITAAGPGAVLLNAPNTYSGATNVTGGMLRLADPSHTSSNNIPNSPAVMVGSGATLDVTGLMNGTFAVAGGQTLSGAGAAGAGTVTGNVTATAGGALGGGSGSNFTINGNVALQDQSHSHFSLGTPNGTGTPSNSFINISGSFSVTGTNIVDLSGAAVLGGTYELYAFASGTPAANQFTVGSNSAGSFTYTFTVVPNTEVDLTVAVGATNAAWDFNGSGNYSDSSKWNPSIPNGNGVIATFGNGVTTTVNVPSLTVTVDGADTVGTLAFNNTNGTGYILGNDLVSGHGITLNNNGGGASITVASGVTAQQQIQANLTLADNLTFNVASGTSMLVTVGKIGGTGNVSLTGGGTLKIDTPSTYVGNTTVNAGALTTTATGTLGTGSLAVNGNAASSTVNLGNNQTVTGLSGTVSGGGSARVNVGAGTSLTVNQSTGTSTFAGTLALVAGSPGGKLTKTGGGTELLTAVPNLGNNSALAVSGGTLKFNTATGTPTIGAGVTANVSSTGTLELAGAASALGTTTVAARVNIMNTSTAAAGVLISGGTQQVGGLDGTGAVQVNSGASLTVNHVTAGALVIGGASGNAATVIIDASDSSGNPTAEPGALAVAGALVPSEPFGAGTGTSSGLSVAAVSSSDGLSSAGGASAGANAGGAAAVPEPTTLLLAGVAGLFSLVAAFRGRSRRVS